MLKLILTTRSKFNLNVSIILKNIQFWNIKSKIYFVFQQLNIKKNNDNNN